MKLEKLKRVYSPADHSTYAITEKPHTPNSLF